jgi:nicotinamide mononucleotide transporter
MTMWTGLETAAALFGLACVVLTVKRNLWCWPTGLAQVTLYIFVFFHAKLYSDLILHVIYVGLSIYGWHHWLHGGADRGELEVTLLPPLHLLSLIAAGLGVTAVWGWLMATYTDAALPYPDAFTTVASLIAQWLLAKKKLQSWWCWIAVDLVAVPVYFYKELYQTAALYTMFLVLASAGGLEWSKHLAREKKALAPAVADGGVTSP